MSDIRFNQWLHNSGTGGVSQVDGGHVGIGTTNPLIPVGAGVTAVLNVGVVTANSYYGSGANLTGIVGSATSLSFNDNIGAYWGNAQDLKIHHDGNHSYIDDQGTGNLRLRSGTLEITNLASNKTSALFSSGGGQTLNFNNSAKFVTTNTGIDVTGSVVADDLIVTGTSVVGDFKSTNNNYVLGIAGNNASDKSYVGTDSSGNFLIATGSGVDERLRITSGGQVIAGHTSTYGGAKLSVIGDSTTALADNAENFSGANDAFAFIYNKNTGNVESGLTILSSGSAGAVYNMYVKKTGSYAGDLIFRARTGAATSAERLRIASDGVITAQKSATFGNTSDSFTALAITASTTGVSELRFADTTANPGYLKYAHSSDLMEFVAGGNNQLYLYGSSKEARFSGYVVAQTMGSGTSSQTPSFGATQSGMDSTAYNYILSASNDGGNKAVMFVNGSSRSADGGANTLTFRNDGGNLRLGNSGTSTNILGNLTIEQPIINQQTKFQYSNSAGVGAYLSLFNTSGTAGSSTGISFGIGSSNAQLDGSDWGEGQIKVYTDSGGYGNMEFNVHVNANRSFMKIVGNGQNYSGASAGSEGMRGGVAFGNAGVALDRSWMGQPGLHVFNQNVEGDTDQGTFRFHGWDRTYASYPASSGSDFGVSLIADGMTLTSDRRRKTDITTITGALNTVSQMRGVSFTYVNRDLKPQTHMSMDNGKKLGFIAQEVIPLLPELILDSGEKAVELENGYCDRYNMDYGGVTPLLVEAIKELKTKNEALEARLAALEGS